MTPNSQRLVQRTKASTSQTSNGVADLQIEAAARGVEPAEGVRRCWFSACLHLR